MNFVHDSSRAMRRSFRTHAFVMRQAGWCAKSKGCQSVVSAHHFIIDGITGFENMACNGLRVNPSFEGPGLRHEYALMGFILTSKPLPSGGSLYCHERQHSAKTFKIIFVLAASCLCHSYAEVESLHFRVLITQPRSHITSPSIVFSIFYIIIRIYRWHFIFALARVLQWLGSRGFKISLHVSLYALFSLYVLCWTLQ